VLSLIIQNGCFELRPADSTGFGFLDDKSVKELTCLFKTFIDGHKAVFMLDGQNSVVAYETELRNEFSPPVFAVAVTNGSEYPCSFLV